MTGRPSRETLRFSVRGLFALSWWKFIIFFGMVGAGDYALTLAGTGTGITDLASNPLSAGASIAWTTHTTPAAARRYNLAINSFADSSVLWCNKCSLKSARTAERRGLRGSSCLACW